MCCVVVIERVSPPPFIAWIGRFPQETNMGTLGTDVGMAVAIFPPKLGPFGAKKGSGDPGVRLTPECRLSHCLSFWTLPGGPPTCVCRCRGFVRQFFLSNGPILMVTHGMESSMCFSLCSLVFSSNFTSGCLQIIIHQSSWNSLELSPTTKFGDQLL